MILKGRLPGLTTQIVIAFVAAILSGLFFGELIVPVKPSICSLPAC